MTVTMLRGDRAARRAHVQDPMQRVRATPDGVQAPLQLTDLRHAGLDRLGTLFGHRTKKTVSEL